MSKVQIAGGFMENEHGSWCVLSLLNAEGQVIRQFRTPDLAVYAAAALLLERGGEAAAADWPELIDHVLGERLVAATSDVARSNHIDSPPA